MSKKIIIIIIIIIIIVIIVIIIIIINFFLVGIQHLKIFRIIFRPQKLVKANYKPIRVKVSKDTFQSFKFNHH